MKKYRQIARNVQNVGVKFKKRGSTKPHNQILGGFKGMKTRKVAVKKGIDRSKAKLSSDYACGLKAGSCLVCAYRSKVKRSGTY